MHAATRPFAAATRAPPLPRGDARRAADKADIALTPRHTRLALQGIVWGTNTELTGKDERLCNRFDYDGEYGTVLNRFLMQVAASGR